MLFLCDYIKGGVNMNKKGFNLSEVLMVMAIIGVVAVLVLPSVIKDTKDREYETARKRVLQTVGEAVRLISAQGNIRDAENAQDFVENYLKKQLQIQKTCSNENLRECGLETRENKIYDINEKSMTMPKTLSELGVIRGYGIVDANLPSYGFVLSNGYSVNLFYNPDCTSNKPTGNCQSMVCVNAVYDINGLSGPNQVGKDIGIITVLYPDIQSKTVALTPFKFVSATYYDMGEACGKDYSPGNVEELTAIYYNKWLLGFSRGSAPTYGSLTMYDENPVSVYFGCCSRGTYDKNQRITALCIKR